MFIANLCLCTRLQKYNSYKLNRYVLKDRPMICQISARFSRKSLRNAVLTLAIIKVFRKSLISKQFVVIQNIKLFDYCWPDFSCSPFFLLAGEGKGGWDEGINKCIGAWMIIGYGVGKSSGIWPHRSSRD